MLRDLLAECLVHCAHITLDLGIEDFKLGGVGVTASRRHKCNARILHYFQLYCERGMLQTDLRVLIQQTAGERSDYLASATSGNFIGHDRVPEVLI